MLKRISIITLKGVGLFALYVVSIVANKSGALSGHAWAGMPTGKSAHVQHAAK